MSLACRYWRIVETPPPTRTSRPPAASLACSNADLNAVGDETELGASGHLDRRAGVVREHEDRRVIGRLVAPPAFPLLVGPGAADRSEHVPAENPRADVVEALRRHVVVDAGLAAGLALRLLPHARVEEPLHELGTSHPERVLQVLMRAGAVAVEGYREASNDEFGHVRQEVRE